VGAQTTFALGSPTPSSVSGVDVRARLIKPHHLTQIVARHGVYEVKLVVVVGVWALLGDDLQGQFETLKLSAHGGPRDGTLLGGKGQASDKLVKVVVRKPLDQRTQNGSVPESQQTALRGRSCRNLPRGLEAVPNAGDGVAVYSGLVGGGDKVTILQHPPNN